MGGRYCKCPNHIRDEREGHYSFGGHLGACEGCCSSYDIAQAQNRNTEELKKQNELLAEQNRILSSRQSTPKVKGGK